MKLFFTLITLLISQILNCQNYIDSFILQEINQYRKSLNLSEVKFDDVCHKSAKLQSIFMKDCTEVINSKADIKDEFLYCGHKNTRPNEKSILDRYVKSGGKKALVGENCFAGSKLLDLKDTISSYKNLAIVIVEAWKKSPGHNKMLIEPKFRFAASNTQMSKSKFKSPRDKQRVLLFTTLILSDMLGGEGKPPKIKTSE